MDTVIFENEIRGLRKDVQALTSAILTLATQAVGSGQCSGVAMLNSIDAVKAVHATIVNLAGRK